MSQTHTKKMVQGAMIASLFGVLSILNTYTGSLFDIFICYVMVVPIVWYGYTYDIKSNIIVALVSMFVIALMGLPYFVISSFSSCLAGLFIGECLKRKQNKGTILLGTFFIMMLNNILIYEVFAGILEVDLIGEMTSVYQSIQTLLPALSKQLSLDVFLSFIPIAFVLLSLMEMYVIILLCQVTLMRLKVEFPGNFHIATMHLSQKSGLIVFIIMLSSYCLNHFFKFNNIYLTYAYTLCFFLFVLQGISFSCFYLILKQKPKLMILTFLLVFLPFGSTIYVVLGILDIFSDLRRNLLYNMNNKE